ncbi:hypothetical protein [Amycolatopsis silviterrae]|uniref:Uncharacterized protein n=1 Tax=Amycolatopsis silviterrae TaxID=1656914 RepID=A0ABW5HL35_9PSEU
MAGIEREASGGGGMTARVASLWRFGNAPAVSGLYRADDTAFAVTTNGAELSWFRIGSPLDLDEVLADPAYTMSVDVAMRTEIEDGSLVCGEGELGADGFFARLDGAGGLRWLVALQRSNPFERIIVSEGRFTVVNNLGNALSLSLSDPRFS